MLGEDDLIHVLRAIDKAGVENARCEIDSDGKIVITIGNALSLNSCSQRGLDRSVIAKFEAGDAARIIPAQNLKRKGRPNKGGLNTVKKVLSDGTVVAYHYAYKNGQTFRISDEEAKRIRNASSCSRQANFIRDCELR